METSTPSYSRDVRLESDSMSANRSPPPARRSDPLDFISFDGLPSPNNQNRTFGSMLDFSTPDSSARAFDLDETNTTIVDPKGEKRAIHEDMNESQQPSKKQKTATHSVGPSETPVRGANLNTVKNTQILRFRPDKIKVGVDKTDGSSPIFARIKQQSNTHPYVDFVNPKQGLTSKRFENVTFADDYIRKNKKQTKAHIKTLFHIVEDDFTAGNAVDEEVIAQPEELEADQDLGQRQVQLAPKSQIAFGLVPGSPFEPPIFDASPESRSDEHKKEVEGLVNKLEEGAETIERLTATIEDQKQAISGHLTTIQERDAHIASLLAEKSQSVLESREGSIAPSNDQVTLPEDPEYPQPKFAELEKHVKAVDTDNENDKPILRFKQDQDNPNLYPITRDLALYDSQSMKESFVKLPANAGASLFKERSGLRFVDGNNKWWQKTRILQDCILVAGTPLDQLESNNGITYDCFDENGKEKRLKRLNEASIVQHEGKFYVEWVILKEIEAEKEDHSL